MTGLTLRERAEEAVKNAADFEIKLGDDPSSDDTNKLVELANSAAELTHQFQALAKAQGDLGSANKVLAGMGLDVDDDPDEDENDKLSGYSGIVNPKAGMTIGEAFAKSDAYQEFVKGNVNTSGELSAGRIGNSQKVDFELSLREAGGQMKYGAVKNLVTAGSDTSGGAFIEPARFPGVIDSAPFDELTLWDLCTKIPITTDSFQWVEITGKTNNADFVLEATATGALASEFPTDGAVSDADGGLKPESDLALAVRTGLVETVAHTIPITRKAAADAPQVMAIINAFMRDGLDEKIEDGILNGTGTSPQLRGLLNGTNPYAINAVTGVGTERVDGLVAAIAAIRAFDRSYRPNAVLVNSTDWFSDTFLTKKDGNGNYMLTSPFQAPGAINLWGLRVVVTDAVPAGTQVVGDWRYALIADRMRAQMYMTDSHKDWFARNILAILAEQMLGFGVMAPKAFATVTV